MVDFRQVRLLGDPRKFALFLGVLFRIPAFWCLLRCMKMPDLLRYLDRPRGGSRAFGREDLEQARLVWKYANFLLIHCFRTKKPCLLRSLILFFTLRRKGIPVQIHFGVKKEEFLREGHCWLFMEGEPFLEQSDPNRIYTRVYVYPDERTAF